jgi:hypothetical protein
MTAQAILLPLFVQAGFTFFLGFWMAYERRRVFLRGELHWRDIALKQTPWPRRAQQLSQSFQNQFEAPVLFYVLVLLALTTKTADRPFVVMEWLFAISRLAHAYVHTTSNYVPARGLIYICGMGVLLLMWAVVLFRIFTASALKGP